MRLVLVSILILLESIFLTTIIKFIANLFHFLMLKYKLAVRLNYYYRLERFHAVWISLFCLFLNIKFGWKESFLLNYGMFLVVFVLMQGTYYWRTKLNKLRGHNVSYQDILVEFKIFQNINNYIISLFPIILLVVVFFFNKIFVLQANKGWALFAYAFGIAEHINYFYVQLMYDNGNDWKYLRIYKKLKIASLRKDFNSNRT